jgi:hypothetical protein
MAADLGAGDGALVHDIDCFVPAALDADVFTMYVSGEIQWPMSRHRSPGRVADVARL